MKTGRQRVVMTGSTSKFGRLVAKLLASKYDLVLIVRNLQKAKEALKGVKAKIVHLDLELATVFQLETTMQKASCIVHIAGLVDYAASRDKLFAANAKVTEKLVAAAVNCKVENFVYCSSIAVYNTSNEVITEKSLVNPRNAYGESKLAGEQAVTTSDLNWICLRPGIIYGPHFTKEVELLVKLAKRKRLKLIGNGNNFVPLVYETDVAKAFTTAVSALLKRKINKQVFNLVGEEKTQRKCFEILQKELKINSELKSVPLQIALNLARFLKAFTQSKNLDSEVLKTLAMNRKFNNSKARALKLKFTSVENGIKKTIKQFKRA